MVNAYLRPSATSATEDTAYPFLLRASFLVIALWKVSIELDRSGILKYGGKPGNHTEYEER